MLILAIYSFLADYLFLLFFLCCYFILFIIILEKVKKMQCHIGKVETKWILFFGWGGVSLLILLSSSTHFISVICCSIFEQAQQLFQRDAQLVTPEALESVKAALASSEIEHKAETKKKAIPRKAAGKSWEDSTLAEWLESMNYLTIIFIYFNFFVCFTSVFLILV